MAVCTEILNNELTLHGGIYSIDGTQAVAGHLAVDLKQDDSVLEFNVS